MVDFPKFRDGPVYAPGWDSGRRDFDSFASFLGPDGKFSERRFFNNFQGSTSRDPESTC